MVCVFSEILFVQTSDTVYLYTATKTETGLYCSTFMTFLGTFTIFIFEGVVTGQVNEYLPNIKKSFFVSWEMTTFAG